MAFIKSAVKFTLKGLNLSPLRNGDVEFFNNVNQKKYGKTFEDVVSVNFDDGSEVNFGGKNFAFDRNDNPTRGVVQGLEVVTPRDKVEFYMTGLSIKATTFNKAIDTNSFTDDLKIWKAAFSGKDTFVLSNKNDNMRGFGGNDVMKGNGGSDTLRGDGGNDRLLGGNGGDTLLGGAGGDNLRGDKGQDVLKGGTGDDVLVGGDHDDTMIGGGGADTFLFNTVGISGSASNNDTIRGFTDGIDTIKIRTTDSFEDLSIEENGGSALIRYSHGTITLQNVDASLISAADFDI